VIFQRNLGLLLILPKIKLEKKKNKKEIKKLKNNLTTGKSRNEIKSFTIKSENVIGKENIEQKLTDKK
jgi:hypothetical protein